MWFFIVQQISIISIIAYKNGMFLYPEWNARRKATFVHFLYHFYNLVV